MTRQSRPAAILAVGMACVLAGCSVPFPEPSATPGLSDKGALLDGQSDRIVRQTLEEFFTADGATDAGEFGDRVGDVPAQVRAAEYIVAANGGSAIDAIPGDLQVVYATDSEVWPRIMVAVTEEPDAAHTPVVMMWVQDASQAPYELRAWAHMVPGGVLPAVPPQSVGAAQLPMDAEGFVMTPIEAIDSYVALLNGGSSSEFEMTFAPDPYRQKMFEARASLVSAAAARSGTYTDTVTARVGESYVLADAEGGALVFLRLEVVSDLSVSGGATLSLSAKDKALLTGTLSTRVVYRYEDFLVIRIGAEGVNVLPSVVAADHHLVGVATT